MASFTASSWQSEKSAPSQKPKSKRSTSKRKSKRSKSAPRKKTQAQKPRKNTQAQKPRSKTPVYVTLGVAVAAVVAAVLYFFTPQLANIQSLLPASETEIALETPTPSAQETSVEAPAAIDPARLAQLVTASYGEAVATQGQADVNGATMSFNTVWLQDASQGTGTITWEGITAEVKLYKGTLLVKNDTKLLDKYAGVDTGIDGWVIVVDETPLLRAFPGKAGVTALTLATPEQMQVEGAVVKVGDITATITNDTVSYYTLPSLEYSIAAVDPRQVQGISPDTFKADGELRKNEAGAWVPAKYE